MTTEEFDSVKKEVIASIGKTLIEKNKRYGNAALEPINVFYKGNARDSILISLDDKYSRILNSTDLRNNDLYDMLGYLFLLCIQEGYCDTANKKEFDKKVSSIQNLLFKNVNVEDVSTSKNAFTKCSSSLIKMDQAIDNIRLNNKEEISYLELMSAIVLYFIENKITDFSNLID